ncbi:MAG: hypothetical protein R6U56_11050 [Opitutales bacterium]
MQKLIKVTPKRLWLAVGLLAASLSPQLFAYQQGTYFLFEIRNDADTAEDTSGRIVVSATVFQNEELKTDTGVAGTKKTGEFEQGINNISMKGGDSVTTGIDILDAEEDDSATEPTFGEDAPASGGFYFSY